jgi:predicted O-methyltransferase YrrM
MFDLLWRIKDFLYFYFVSKKISQLPDIDLSIFIHSILKKDYFKPDFIKFEELRNELTNDNSVIEYMELGAGKRKSGIRSIKSVARSSLSPQRKCHILHNIAVQAKPGTILELGTSLGLSTAYLAASNKLSVVHTIDGNKSVAQIAESNFIKLGLNNIIQYEGKFDEIIDKILDIAPTITLAYIDGNHKKKTTINYFLKILKKCHTESIIIFDDIHWSKDMFEAWINIKSNPEVMCSIDLYQIGIVLLNEKFTGHHKIMENLFISNAIAYFKL